ncbi:MAG: preprotein translocase subunit SecG [Deltaproteobacteria bacterium]|nr:MAG: preprotein translocase subunit SecG [Deltaproteobacteria bacterium]
MENLLLILHVVVCFLLIAIVLLQHGKGADVGATFGGSSQSLFGSEGPVPLLNKITTGVAIIFMLTSVTLAYLSSQASKSTVMASVAEELPATAENQSQVVAPAKVQVEEEKREGEDTE